MLERRSIVGLSMLCAALAVCAVAAQSASAAFTPATNFTAFTCAEGGGSKDFSDAHCDKAVTAGTGKFGHVVIANGTKTEIEATNSATKNGTTESTPAVYEWTVAGAHVIFTAKKVTGKGFIENSEPSAGKHKVSGELTFELSEITIDEPKNCKVKEPIKMTTVFEGVEEGANMGLEFKPKEGTTFFSTSYDNSGEGSCSINGVNVQISGTKISTGGAGATAKGSGATSVFEPGNGMESLKAGGGPASLTLTTTTKMVGGNPIALTTTT